MSKLSSVQKSIADELGALGIETFTRTMPVGEALSKGDFNSEKPMDRVLFVVGEGHFGGEFSIEVFDESDADTATSIEDYKWRADLLRGMGFVVHRVSVKECGAFR